MFSLGELVLTGAVALIVLGPKRLLHTAYQLGKTINRMHQLLQPVKQAFEQQTKQIELQHNRQRAKAAEEQSITSANHR